jgi:hypothetical protein
MVCKVIYYLKKAAACRKEKEFIVEARIRHPAERTSVILFFMTLHNNLGSMCVGYGVSHILTNNFKQ